MQNYQGSFSNMIAQSWIIFASYNYYIMGSLKNHNFNEDLWFCKERPSGPLFEFSPISEPL